MEIIHKIRLTSGKEIELSEQEYKEIELRFSTIETVYVPYYPSYPTWPTLHIYPTTCTSDTLDI